MNGILWWKYEAIKWEYIAMIWWHDGWSPKNTLQKLVNVFCLSGMTWLIVLGNIFILCYHPQLLLLHGSWEVFQTIVGWWNYRGSAYHILSNRLGFQSNSLLESILANIQTASWNLFFHCSLNHCGHWKPSLEGRNPHDFQLASRNSTVCHGKSPCFIRQ